MKYIVGFEQDIPPYKMLEADSVEEATCMVEEYINVHPTDAYITTAPVEEPKSCYGCGYCIWTRNFKECMLLQKTLPVAFRINARLKVCPLANDAR